MNFFNCWMLSQGERKIWLLWRVFILQDEKARLGFDSDGWEMVVAGTDVRESVDVGQYLVRINIRSQIVSVLAFGVDNQVSKHSQFRTSWFEILSLVIP